MSTVKTYFLKTALIARGLAELTVLIILCILPLGLLISHQFFSLHLVVKIAVSCLSPLSGLGIWGLLKIPFQVKLSESGVSVRSLSKKETVPWENLLSIKQTSNYGLKQYSLVHKGGELSFPRMLNNVSELLGAIKSRIPGKQSATINDGKIFQIPKISFFVDCLKWVLQAAFAVFFAQFASSLAISAKNTQTDLFIIYLAAVLIFMAVFWNLSQLLKMPQQIVLDQEGISFKSLLRKSRIFWTEIKGVQVAGVFYPEGLLLSSKKGAFLLSANTNEIDELSEIVSEKLSHKALPAV